METVTMHISVTIEAADLLEKYCTKRTRGVFISGLVVAHDKSQIDGQGAIDALRRKAKEAAQEASRAANALKKFEELYVQSPAQPQSNANGKKRR